VARWAAFYADCRHELHPIRSGFRVALVYNLGRDARRAPRVPDARREVARVGEVLRAWEAQSGAPPKLVYPLRHRYSLAELSFRGLKNEDAAVAGVLAPAAASTGVIFRLATRSWPHQKPSTTTSPTRSSSTRPPGGPCVTGPRDSEQYSVLVAVDHGAAAERAYPLTP
jgi:hypothetical protein